VVRNDDEAIGMVKLLFTLSTAEGGLVLVLEDRIIKSEYRGRGAGTALLQHAVDFRSGRVVPGLRLLQTGTMRMLFGSTKNVGSKSPHRPTWYVPFDSRGTSIFPGRKKWPL
jgi:GNAT superfamily N-acetyltransferase